MKAPSIAFFGFSLMISFFGSLQLNAQSIENINYYTVDNRTYITYDLVDVKENQLLDVRIYAHVKGIDKPIHKVSGDLGRGVIAGLGKTIIWNSDEELTTHYLEDISFKIIVTAKQYYRAAKR